MESPPPQEPAGGRKSHGPGAAATPPWLWLLLIAGFGLILWQFKPRNEATVHYSPWFLDQVDNGNIKSLTIQGLEVSGELREKVLYTPPSATVPQQVARFATYFPSEMAIDPIVYRIREQKLKPGQEPTLVDAMPPQAANTFVWITLLLPTFVIVGLIYFMMRRARGRFDGDIDSP